MNSAILVNFFGINIPQKDSFTHHLSNQGQSRISARVNCSPNAQGPIISFQIISKLLLMPQITAFFSSSPLEFNPFVEQKEDINLPGTPQMNLLILSRSKGWSGMRLVPVEKDSATYQEIRSLSAMTWFPCMRIGTFPSDVRSAAQALLQIYVNQGSFLSRLASFIQNLTFFSSKVIHALWAKGQIGFMIRVTALDAILIIDIVISTKIKKRAINFLIIINKSQTPKG